MIYIVNKCCKSLFLTSNILVLYNAFMFYVNFVIFNTQKNDLIKKKIRNIKKILNSLTNLSTNVTHEFLQKLGGYVKEPYIKNSTTITTYDDSRHYYSDYFYG